MIFPLPAGNVRSRPASSGRVAAWTKAGGSTVSVVMSLMTGFNASFAVFIGNVVSVALIAYPFTPWAIKALDWWLAPKEGGKKGISFLGALVLLAIYACYR